MKSTVNSLSAAALLASSHAPAQVLHAPLYKHPDLAPRCMFVFLMGKKRSKEVVAAPVYGRPPAGTPSKFVVLVQHAAASASNLFFRLEIKFDAEKIGNFVTGFAKVFARAQNQNPHSLPAASIVASYGFIAARMAA
jgi:hypothetical protein